MDRTNIKMYSEDEIIIAEGTVNAEMYKIVSGQAAVYFDYGKETEYLVGVLSDGRCFGETGLLTGKPSPFSVVAVTDIMLLGINADDFEAFISEEPKNAADIMRNLARTVVTMGANVNMLKEEMLRALDDKEDAQRFDRINQSIMKYRVSGMAGSPYFSKIG